MTEMKPRTGAPSGSGLVGLFFAVLLITALYVGGEWLITQQVKTALTDILRQDTSAQVEVESVGLDGWLLSGSRSGKAVVLLPSEERVPVTFSMVGNPVTGATITVEGDQLLRLRLREWFGSFL